MLCYLESFIRLILVLLDLTSTSKIREEGREDNMKEINSANQTQPNHRW